MKSRLKWDSTFLVNGKKKHNGYICESSLEDIRAYNSTYLGERFTANVTITWQGKDLIDPWEVSIINQLSTDSRRSCHLDMRLSFRYFLDAKRYADDYFNEPRKNKVSIRRDGIDSLCWGVRMKGVKAEIAGVFQCTKNEWRVYSSTHTKYRDSGFVVHSLQEAKEVAAREWYSYQGLLWQKP